MKDFVIRMASAEYENLEVYIALIRWFIPILAALLLVRCAIPLLTFRRDPEIWAWLCIGEKKEAITHWENVIGKSRRSDIIINAPGVSRTQAVLTRYDDGSWTLSNVSTTDEVYVNGKPIDVAVLREKDVITIGGIQMKLEVISQKQEQRLAELRTQAPGVIYAMANLMVLTFIQLLFCAGFLMTTEPVYAVSIATGFGGIFIAQWLLFLLFLLVRRNSFEVETLAFFLCTVGMAAIATVKPLEATKQILAMSIGIVLFLVVGWSLRDLDRAKVCRYLAAFGGIGFLVVTLLFGEEYYGAKNWLELGSMSLQPSELTKVCFVYVGASSMDRLLRKRNLFLFIAYSACICVLLALMNDFGTALIFFCAFLIVAYLRSGNIGTIALACSSVGFAGVLALKIAPHALQRFLTWRHIWESPLKEGYQQTRALMCIASGGLLGVGVNRGWLENVFSADSDVVFAAISEEWGLILATICVLSLLVLGMFTVRCASVGRSGFCTIGACAAVGILLLQGILNVLGTVDVLPLTGVTFPFLSNGGSSMICAWGLLAFIKGADTRQNASFAVAGSRKKGE